MQQNYNPEHSYPYDLAVATKEQENKLEELEAQYRKMAHCYKTTTIQAGEMLEIKISPFFKKRSDYNIVRTYKASSERQKKQNAKMAREKFIRIFSANFQVGDIFFTGGFIPANMPATLEEAKKEVTKYIERIRYHMKRGKEKGPLKYLYVIETVKTKEGETFHVHMVLSANAGANAQGVEHRDMVEQLWKGGSYTNTKRLQLKETGGFTGISTYFTKQFKDLEEPEQPYLRRWGQSLGLVPWTKKPSQNYSKFSKRKVWSMAQAPATLKEEFEKQYPDYQYNEEYPCQIGYNDLYGGLYFYCRMYRRRGRT